MSKNKTSLKKIIYGKQYIDQQDIKKPSEEGFSTSKKLYNKLTLEVDYST